MILSILIATLEERRPSFELLYSRLRGQVLKFGLHGRVEIISNRDSGQLTIGAKRNALVAAAKGDYVCHIDDDDDCADDYVARIASACTAKQDCVGLVGRVCIDGKWRRFEHSLKHRKYTTRKDGTYLRPPNHLNAIRRSIARAYTFPSKNYGEDTEWAMGLVHAKVLQSEAWPGDEPLYFYTPARR